MSLSIWQEIVSNPLSSSDQRAAAQKMLDAQKPQSEPTAIKGNVTLPGATFTRGDGTQWSCGPLVVSEDYAKELRLKFGTLTDGRAVSWAAGSQMDALLNAYYGTMTEQEFLAKWPASAQRLRTGLQN